MPSKPASPCALCAFAALAAFAAFAALALGGGAALAEPPLDEPPPPPTAKPEEGPMGERVVLPAKRLYGRALLEFELSKDTAFDPVSLTPDIYYGVSADFTVGLVHSSLGATGIIGAAGDSLCFTESCSGVYRNFGLDGRYSFTSGKFALAANFGLYAGELDPFRLALKLGIVGRYRPSPTSKLAVDFAPALFIGITEREPEMLGQLGNKEVFVVPLTVLYTVAPRVTALVQTGLAIPFEAAGDAYFVPLSLGASYAINKQISVEGAFSFLHLLGGDALLTGADARSLTIGGGYAF
ncbi:MAG TPA: hypothetical protein VNO30_08770 [Kofleriaceae bacterium]|nr:hypothetical protein [Kofleriaceae bacterium]